MFPLRLGYVEGVTHGYTRRRTTNLFADRLFIGAKLGEVVPVFWTGR